MDIGGQIVEYPSLGLSGSLSNRRSDIGLGLAGGPQIWLEAKTAVTPAEVLHQQLVDEEQALLALTPGQSVRVVAILPRRQPDPKWPALYWDDILNVTPVIT